MTSDLRDTPSVESGPGTLLPVVLAGGYGTRLWPASRRLRPKQFLQIGGAASLLQRTLGRLKVLEHTTPITVCSEDHRFLAAEQLRTCGLESAPILLEPEGRNTAAAVAVSALYAVTVLDDPLLLVLPSDHLLSDLEKFRDAVATGIPFAMKDRLVTFGVPPVRPETGYGYIARGTGLGGGACEVARFVEKPDRDTAEQFVSDGNFYWNSGMFLFRASTYLEELRRHAPAVLAACRASMAPGGTSTDRFYPFIRPDAAAFVKSPKISVDRAVMERTEQAVVVPLDAGWSDVGSWSALWETGKRDGNDNLLRGDVFIDDVRNCLIESEHTLVGCIGLDNLVVVVTSDAVLVADRHRAQDVQELVQAIKAEGRREYSEHRQIIRPWGWFDTVDRGDRYQVKRISVRPGARLSLQYHRFRAEHWVVVSGVAHVSNGGREYVVNENESTFIPSGSTHSLENRGNSLLELIEIQSGSYLGEDDIVRLEDRYGREDDGGL